LQPQARSLIESVGLKALLRDCFPLGCKPQLPSPTMDSGAIGQHNLMQQSLPSQTNLNAYLPTHWHAGGAVVPTMQYPGQYTGTGMPVMYGDPNSPVVYGTPMNAAGHGHGVNMPHDRTPVLV
jgi:hypothetical protein